MTNVSTVSESVTELLVVALSSDSSSRFCSSGVNVIKSFSSSLTMRPDKLKHLSLETLSSQVLEFEARPEPTQLEDLSDASVLGKLLVLPANVRLDWKVIVRYKQSSLFGLFISNEGKKFYNIVINLVAGIQKHLPHSCSG